MCIENFNSRLYSSNIIIEPVPPFGTNDSKWAVTYLNVNIHFFLFISDYEVEIF